jgi:hypothetical protein
MDEGQPKSQGGVGKIARVERTGIALVHEGELILPAAGSEAQASQVTEDAQSVIHYHFPVEIEVRAAPEFVDIDEIVQATLSHLAQSLESV